MADVIVTYRIDFANALTFEELKGILADCELGDNSTVEFDFDNYDLVITEMR